MSCPTSVLSRQAGHYSQLRHRVLPSIEGEEIMMDIKKFAAGVIAGAAITAAPLMAFAAPASAATSTADPAAAAASHGAAFNGAAGQFRWRLIFRAHVALRWRHAL